MPPFPPNTSGVHTMGLLLMYPCTRVGYPVCYSRSIYRQTVPARVFPGPARPSRVCPYSPSAVRSPAGPLGDALVVGPPPPPRCCSFSFFPPFLWRLFLLVWRRSLPLSAAAAAAIQSSAPPPPPGPPATSPAALAPSAAGTAAAAASSAAPACPGRSPRPRRPPGSGRQGAEEVAPLFAAQKLVASCAPLAPVVGPLPLVAAGEGPSPHPPPRACSAKFLPLLLVLILQSCREKCRRRSLFASPQPLCGFPPCVGGPLVAGLRQRWGGRRGGQKMRSGPVMGDNGAKNGACWPTRRKGLFEEKVASKTTKKPEAKKGLENERSLSPCNRRRKKGVRRPPRRHLTRWGKKCAARV